MSIEYGFDRVPQYKGSARRLNIAFTGLIEQFDAKVTPEWLAAPFQDSRVNILNTLEVNDGEVAELDADDPHFTFAPYSLESDTTGAMVIVPVGEYGAEWAKKLIHASEKLIIAATEFDNKLSIHEEVTKISKKYGETNSLKRSKTR